jgi:cell division protein FtsB
LTRKPGDLQRLRQAQIWLAILRGKDQPAIRETAKLKARLAELVAENATLKARIEELTRAPGKAIDTGKP